MDPARNESPSNPAQGPGLRRGGSRSFTLVEITVSIGILLLLIGIVLTVGRTVFQRAEVQRTRDVILVLEAAVQERAVVAQRSLTWWQEGDDPDTWDGADVHSNTEEVFIISEVLDAVSGPVESLELLARIDGRFIYTYHRGSYPGWIDTPQERSQLDQRFDRSLTVLDAWDVPIYAIHPGRPWVPRDGRPPYFIPRDPDGKIRTYNEERYGVAANRQVVFVSAGPDRRFGLPEEFANLVGKEREDAVEHARRDNIYSAPVIFDE